MSEEEIQQYAEDNLDMPYTGSIDCREVCLDGYFDLTILKMIVQFMEEQEDNRQR